MITLTSEECQAIGKKTRKQANSKVWFQQRAGRITAKQMKSACHTHPSKPSKSLVKTVCYPEEHKFSTAATRWGIANELKAREVYRNEACCFHERFTVTDSGLNVNTNWPMLGASPDGFVFCNCCGKGVCEIKCPYTFRDLMLHEIFETQKQFCLSPNNGIHLDKGHSYYYQVQSQIFICEVDYCDFVLWTTKDIYVERVLRDKIFWNNVLTKALAFFKNGILPKFYTRSPSLVFTAPSAATSEVTKAEEGPWCTCQQDIDGSVLMGCDNEQCKIQWFHMSCMDIQQPPEGDCFCPTCQPS